MKDLLDKSIKNLLCEFWEFSQKTEELLKELNVKVKLPIDIQEIAKKLGFTIEIKSKVDYNYQGCVSQSTILIPYLPYKETRWFIAKAIAHYFSSENEVKRLRLAADKFLVSQDPDDYYLDTLAMLILFPISLFKQEVSENIGKTDNLLEYLSNESQIPEFQLAIGYQSIKQMLCFQREKEFQEHNYDITQVPSDPYDNIFF